MAVPEVNITIEQGTDYEDVFTVRNPNGTPLDLTGYSASAAVKKFPTSLKSGIFWPNRPNSSSCNLFSNDFFQINLCNNFLLLLQISTPILVKYFFIG